ncbi:MAG: Crp/Fnr family transcriptional regulator [Alistipes sp.]|jgi:CRP-like cAMP-binding protein|nr:Crp/Fnr family transcriptional regulator [Alistipes sp.]
METLKKQLSEECSYRMRDETMDRFLGLMTETVELKDGEPLIPYGRFDNNVYVLKSGIVRSVWFDGLKETTFAFALPGTVIISYYSFYLREPSFSQFEACCDSAVMKIPKAGFVELMEQSHDFAQWVAWMSLSQLWFYEKKRLVVNGDARERFESLLRNRPEIIEKVRSKVIASYIGITPQYLSNLKKTLMPKR